MFAQMWFCMHEWCQSWLMTICFQPQSRLCKYLSFFTNIYIFSQLLYTHILNFITIGWKHDVISYDWHHSCMHNHVCANIWVFFTNIYICTIIIYSHSKFYNNWLKTYCHQSWLTSFMHAQSHLCKHLIFLLIYILAQSLYTHIPNFIAIGWKHDVISHDWHHSCMHNHVCANIWVFY